MLKAVLVDPEYNGKIKHASIRKNRNVIQIDSTETQIAADELKKGGSFPQALLMVNEHRMSKGLGGKAAHVTQL